MTELGKMERLEDLCDVWKHEEKDFSVWLAKKENLAMLGETVGIDIDCEERERESYVGRYFVDIYATEKGTGRKIIIENQLKDTDHDHLGKIITYAAGKEASVIIWIVKHANDEHRQAVEWLNQHTDESIGFFLIEVELWKIDNSRPAPRFNIVERPNDWAKAIKTSGISDTKIFYLEYWKAFQTYVDNKADAEFKNIFGEKKRIQKKRYDIPLRNAPCMIRLYAISNHIQAWLWFNNNEELYNHFFEQSTAIKEFLGEEIVWVDKNLTVAHFGFDIDEIDNSKIDFSSSDNWEEYFDWYCDKAKKLYKIVGEFSESNENT